MNKENLAEDVVNRMMKNDEFSRWLGIEVQKIKPGYSRLKMKIRKDMLNGFYTCHGGITFSLADSALAFASNNHGKVAVALEASIAFPTPVYEGDELTAIAEEQSKGNSVAVYNVTIKNQANVNVGIFRGTVYRTKKEHFPNKTTEKE